MKETFTSTTKTLLIVTIALLCGQNVLGQFIPGAGGDILYNSPFTNIPGKIGGLYIQCTERENAISGTRALVKLSFPYPSVFGATSYTLQFSSNNGSTWGNFQVNGVDLTTTGDSLSFNPTSDFTMRLLVNGGLLNGCTSNEVSAPLSGVDTQFSGWSLDERQYLTGVLSPFVGRGIATKFTVKKLLDNSKVDGFLSYQWYRVNPATYETTIIPNAIIQNYTTTPDDAGYLLLIKATGDGVKVGGFAQILVTTKTVIPNNAFISDITNSGFTLNLFKTVPNLTDSDLLLYDKDSNQVIISLVKQGANAAIYNITVPLDFKKGPYYLLNIPNYWSIVTDIFSEIMTEGIKIDVTNGLNDIPENAVIVYPIPTVNTVYFKAGTNIIQAAIMNVNGSVLLQSTVNKDNGNLNVSELNNGIYLVRLVTANGVFIRKIQILK